MDISGISISILGLTRGLLLFITFDERLWTPFMSIFGSIVDRNAGFSVLLCIVRPAGSHKAPARQ